MAYFLYHLRCLPAAYIGLDTNRLTACYFCLSALDLLDALDHLEQPRARIIEWIYSLQVLPTTGDGCSNDIGEGHHSDTNKEAQRQEEGADSRLEEQNDAKTTRRLSDLGSWASASAEACRDCGFIGSAFLGGERFHPVSKVAVPATAMGPVHGHIAMTYTALASLLILGDDLTRIAREPILAAVRQLQQDTDGRFVAHHRGGESDCRFLYCACAVAFILAGMRTHMDVHAMRRYVRQCVHGYDGAIGLIPGQESHGGACYTAVAGVGLCAEALGEQLNIESHIGLKETSFAHWCLSRQVSAWSGVDGVGGFQGRVNKVADTCYTFWVLGALQMLDRGKLHGTTKNKTAEEADIKWLDMYNKDAIRKFLLDKDTGTHDHLRGGFGKIPGTLPDVLHSYYGICGLALIGHEQDAILPLDASLGISQRARSWLKEVQVRRGWT